MAVKSTGAMKVVAHGRWQSTSARSMVIFPHLNVPLNAILCSLICKRERSKDLICLLDKGECSDNIANVSDLMAAAGK